MKPPIQFRPTSKLGKEIVQGLKEAVSHAKGKTKLPGRKVPPQEKEHATVGSRRVVASGQNPKGTPIKTGDEVSVAQATHGQSSEPQQLNFDRKAYQRDYMRDKRAADKLGLTVAEYREKKK